MNNSMDSILSGIHSVNDRTDLRILRQAVADKIEYVSKQMKHKLSQGDVVTITSRNKVETGTIKKVNISRAVVNINGLNYNVPFSMITKENK